MTTTAFARIVRETLARNAPSESSLRCTCGDCMHDLILALREAGIETTPKRRATNGNRDTARNHPRRL